MAKPWEEYQDTPPAEKPSADAGKPWDNYANPEDQPSQPQATQAPMGLLDKIDAYNPFGAAMRSSVGAIEQGNDPISAYTKQYGKNPATAPTDRDLVKPLGLSDKPILPDWASTLLQKGVQHMPGGGLVTALAPDAFKVSPEDVATQVAGTVRNLPVAIAGGKALGAVGKFIPETKMTGLMSGPDITEAASASEATPASTSSESVPNAPATPDMTGPDTPNRLNTPKTLAELKANVESYKKAGANLDLPSWKTIQDESKYLPDIEHDLIPPQEAALKNKSDANWYQTMKRNPLDTTGFAKYATEKEALQKQELNDKFDSTIANLGGRAPITNPTEAGDNAVQLIVNKAQEAKQQLGPIFQAIGDTKVESGPHIDDLVNDFEQKFPGLKGEDVFQKEQTSIPGMEDDPDAGTRVQYSMKPWSRNTGLNPGPYNTLKDVFEDVANNPKSTAQIWNIRKTLYDSINPQDRSTKLYSDINQVLLGHIERLIGVENPELAEKVHPTFQSYAKLSQNLGDMEWILGGGPESLSNMKNASNSIVSENVLKRLFNNSQTVKSTKDALGSDFNGVLGDYVASLKQQATDGGGNVSGSNLFGKLGRAQGPLQEAFGKDSFIQGRLKALANRMRMVPDAPPYNTSATSPTAQMFKALNPFSPKLYVNPHGQAEKFMEGAKGLLEKRAMTNEINARMAGGEFSAPTPTGYLPQILGAGALNELQNQNQKRKGLLSAP